MNTSIAEFVSMVGASSYHIGHPISAKMANPVSCDIGLGVLVTGFLSNAVYKVWAEGDEVVCFGDIH